MVHGCELRMDSISAAHHEIGSIPHTMSEEDCPHIMWQDHVPNTVILKSCGTSGIEASCKLYNFDSVVLSSAWMTYADLLWTTLPRFTSSWWTVQTM